MTRSAIWANPLRSLPSDYSGEIKPTAEEPAANNSIEFEVDEAEREANSTKRHNFKALDTNGGSHNSAIAEQLSTPSEESDNYNTSRLDMPAADKKSKAKERMKRVARILRNAAASAVA